MHKRIDTLDVTKGIGILLVLFAHIYTGNSAETIIYAFHMPLFFVASGMLFKPEKYNSLRELFISRARTLLCPYVFFCVIGVLPKIAFAVLKSGFSQDLFDLLRQFAISIVWAPYSLRYFSSFNTPLWFVPCLLLVQIIYYLLFRLFENKTDGIIGKALFWTAVVVIGIAGWVTELPSMPVNFAVLPWNFSSACYSLCFFAIGRAAFPVIKKYIITPDKNNKQILILVLLTVAGFTISTLVGLVNGKISIGSRELNNGLLLYVSGLAGTLGTIALSRLLSESKFLQYCGRNSFRIMGIHLVVFNLLKYVEEMIFSEDGINDYILLIDVVIVAVLTLIFVYVYNLALKKIKASLNKKSKCIV